MNYLIPTLHDSHKSLHPLHFVFCSNAFANAVSNMILHKLSIRPLSQVSFHMHIMHWIIDWVGHRSITRPLRAFNIYHPAFGGVMTLLLDAQKWCRVWDG